MRNHFSVFIFLGVILITSSQAAEVSLGELMLVATGVGDAAADEGGYSKSEGAARITDDTQKACGLYNYLKSFEPAKKRIDAVTLAKNFCFASFPEEQRFGLALEGQANLKGYGKAASTLARKNFASFKRDEALTRQDILSRSSQAAVVKGKKSGSFGNGACMGIAPLAGMKGFHDLEVTKLNQTAKEIAEITHNHPDGTASAQAMAMAMHYIVSQKKQGKNISADLALEYVKTNVSGFNIGRCCNVLLTLKKRSFPFDELNRLSPDYKESRRLPVLRGTWGPNSVITAIYLALNSLAEHNNQMQLLKTVEEHCNDVDTIGAMSLSLRVLIDDGFDDSIDDDQITKVIRQIPAFLEINNDVGSYRKR